MRFEGTRVKQEHWVHAGPCVVWLEVDAVIPVDDPSEPCYEPQTIELLRQVQERAQAGDIEWLKRVGNVYVRLSA
jgi:hypothetical protein